MGYPDRRFVWYTSILSLELLGSALKHTTDISFHNVSNLSLEIMEPYDAVEKDSLNEPENKQISSLISEMVFSHFVF
jgi:hypothetical protein